jgi:hypothetical protein
VGNLLRIEEAEQHPCAVAVLEGDWGGTIYATIPLRLTDLDADGLKALALNLERIFWSCNIDEDSPEGGAAAYLTLAKPGEGVLGGMGGGCVVDGTWIHPDLGDEARSLIQAAERK